MEIVTRPTDQVVWVGENATLFCDAVGNPAPNITYSVVGENTTVGHGKTLVINSSSVPYVKVYTCTADNGIQTQASVNATVTVLGKSFIAFYFFSLVSSNTCIADKTFTADHSQVLFNRLPSIL